MNAAPNEPLNHRPPQPPSGLPPSRTPTIVVVAIVAVVTVLAALVAGVLIATTPGSVTRGVLTSSSNPPRSAPVITEHLDRRTAQPVHDALHDIAARCPTETGPTPATIGPDQLSTSDRRQLKQDAALIVSFARRHPHAQFPIDDEQGTTLSLLLVAREALGPCSPAAAQTANELLPTEYQSR